MLGQIEGGLIATGKHFPGRGASKTDAHYSVPVVDESAERMHDVHLAPYRKLIEHGLPAIMLAHSIYPAIDPDEEVATISKRIVTGLLREEMGFDGVVMTDSFTMAGLMMRVEVAEGVVRAIEAGVDLILLKDETALRGEVFNFVLESIRKGRLSEERVNESVARTLIMKERFGMLDGRKGIVDIDELRSVHADPEHRKIATQAAERSVVVLRKEGDIFPFKPGTKVLVVEEPFGLQREMNNSTAYCGAIYQRLRRHGVDAYFTDFDSKDIDKAWPVIQERASWCDVVVFTGYRRRGRDQVQMEAYERFLALGKPLIFVANSPYPMLVSPKLPTVLVTCHTGALSSYAVADILVGDVEPTGQFGFDPAKTY
jgi:beta-N-acetylhexosaminidase